MVTLVRALSVMRDDTRTRKLASIAPSSYKLSMSAAGTTSRIDEIRARLAAVNWRARTQTDRDISISWSSSRRERIALHASLHASVNMRTRREPSIAVRTSLAAGVPSGKRKRSGITTRRGGGTLKSYS